MTDLKDHAVPISLSTVISIASVGSIMWFLLQPIVVTQVSDELQESFEEQIDKKQAPIQLAFKTLLRQEIESTKKSIALLEHRRDHDGESWTQDHALLLVERYAELEALEEAYGEL